MTKIRKKNGLKNIQAQPLFERGKIAMKLQMTNVWVNRISVMHAFNWEISTCMTGYKT